MKHTGAEILMRSLLQEKVEVIFGYPGGANMPIYDALYFYEKKLRHILVRHEQGAAHAAEGYARVTGKPGVCLVTSGPGATNLVTGIADAMMDSVPIVCVTGQVAAEFLGSDAFQETDVIGVTTPITKWNRQLTHADEIPEAVAKAFYIASHGRPGPVVIDITKNTQFEKAEFNYPKNFYIKKLKTVNKFNNGDIEKAAEIINNAKKPLMLVGHGVLISKAEKEVLKVIEKTGMVAASTLHGLSSIPFDHPLYVGMLGMHGNYSPNKLTNSADVLFAVGMRFDDRVTSKLSEYAPHAKVIHIDIDESEHHKNIHAHVPLVGNVKDVLKKLTPLLKKNNHVNWLNEFKDMDKKELAVEKNKQIKNKNKLTMDVVLSLLSKKTKNEAIIVADVGQNQMFAARYYKYKNPDSYITSGGLGTMGFAVPAAIGAKIGAPKRLVFAVVGDGGIQMTIQEFGTIMQEKLPIKILLLNNEYLGMVRQWQQLFFEKRYSFTHMESPDFIKLARSYNISGEKVVERNKLDSALDKFINFNGPYLLEVKVEKEDNIFPMVATGTSVDEVRLE
ncbi:MAG: Acetolactate synthase [Candidatus Roizmanbacteria bacterium GW2011_GWA2_35_19]|uniref:Acetolactate synthase n=2 Tax=Candidatus Roizmaniibacteriota TaxID=1752723 RepID=A0A0G0F182_9BACT|nr:MAG: Acetolactate synthase [Candidatus Roizmanbacteria bacterium GW2011_GWC2_35_12]KKP73112.1 MAG: Acetolactate synthase [Candidatus Roizmanbacteria bacterium GW2011_GWA2_35_19]